MEREWKSSCVGYEIKYKARFDEFEWYSFYDNEYGFYDDGENNRLELKKKLLSSALNIAYSECSRDMYAYMKLETEIKNEQILECTRIN